MDRQLAEDLSRNAQMAPSCFNNQPWRFIFVYEPAVLESAFSSLTPGNKWARSASMIVAVASRRDLDCVSSEREYYLFDTGMATAFLILRATELGLVAHPIAGYDEARIKEILGIPADLSVITLVVIGKRSNAINPVLSSTQIKAEKKRPERLPLREFVHMNRFQGERRARAV